MCVCEREREKEKKREIVRESEREMAQLSSSEGAARTREVQDGGVRASVARISPVYSYFSRFPQKKRLESLGFGKAV